MARKWRDLYDKLPPDRRARIEAAVQDELATMPLQDLRVARKYTQARLAERLDKDQSEISRLERRTDMYVSTLRRYIEAMGGELEIVARFPEGSVRIDSFHEGGRDDGREAVPA